VPYDISFDELASEELDRLRAFDRVSILAAIQKHLIDEPLLRSRNRKPLTPDPSIRTEGMWECRVGQWRIFYHVEEESNSVIIRMIRRKPRGKTTAEVLSEDDSG
jgi:addiction module RelE/StbE family toxin